MKLLYCLNDDQYDYSDINHTRKVARAVVVNGNGKVALMVLNRNDDFGKFHYYETPGGGVNENESIRDAVLREMKEEIGCDCDVLNEIGIVDDYYNLIHRHNLNYYFLLKVKSFGDSNLEEYEKDLFEEVLWIDIDDAIRFLENMGDSMIPLLVKRRELPIYKLAKDMLIKEKLI